MAAQDCAKVAFDLGLRKVKVFVKGQVTDVSLLSELYTEQVLRLLKLLTLLHCHTTVVVLRKAEEFN